MKVKELIEDLKKADPEAIVLIPSDSGKVGMSVVPEFILQTTAKQHADLDEIYIDEVFYKNFPTKGEEIIVVAIN